MNMQQRQMMRARLLLDQNRYVDAEKELKNILSIDPNDPEALSLLARVKLDTNAATEAIPLLDRALAAYPDDDYTLYLKAFAFFKTNNISSAINTLNEAIAINPYSPGYFALFAYIYQHEKQYEKALAMANEGLALHPEDIGCLNARSRSLNRLNRIDDAISTMQDTLAADPENDFSHENVGWNYLEKGKQKKAAHHFREALRINPSNRGAKDGMKEALKSNIAPYRWFLMYGIWLNEKGRTVRIGMTVGIYILFRFISTSLTHLTNPWLSIGYVLIGLYLLAVLVSWLIEPIANFILSFHKEGKYAITQEESLISRLVVGSVTVGLVIFLCFLLMPLSKDYAEMVAISALVWAMLSLPLSRIKWPLGQNFKVIDYVFTAIVVLGCLAGIALLFGQEWGYMLSALFGIALVVSSWISAFKR